MDKSDKLFGFSYDKDTHEWRNIGSFEKLSLSDLETLRVLFKDAMLDVDSIIKSRLKMKKLQGFDYDN